MTVLPSLICKLTQIILASPLEHVMMLICPLLEPILGFQFSCILVEKFVKLLVNMVGGVLNVELPNPVHSMQCFAKEHLECKVKIISLKTSIGVLIPCYDGWWNSFKGGF